MSHLPDENNFAFELEFQQQDTARTGFAQVYRNPFKGISLTYQNFGNPDVLGSAVTIFAHNTLPIAVGEMLGTLYARVGTGLSYINKRYEVDTNPKNNAIGSYFNGYVNLQLRWRKYFDQWHIGAGIEFAHYSNAAMKVPNLGLNTPMISAEVGYDLHPVRHSDKLESLRTDFFYKDRMADELRLFFIGSSKQNPIKFHEPKNRAVLALQMLYSKGVGKRWKVDAGIDLIYNDANRHYLDTSAYTIGETFQLGVFLGASLHVYRAEFITGLGYYVYSPVHPFGRIYNRLGFRYHFSSKLSGMVGIKAHLGIADYLEFGLAYQLWRSK